MSVSEATAVISASDWLQASLEVIAESGVDALAVAPLAERLGVTERSFLDFFETRDELLQRTLDEWEVTHGEESLQSIEAIPDPAHRLDTLLMWAIGHSQNPGPSVFLSLLRATDNPAVRNTVTRVGEARQRLIATGYEELGFEPDAAVRRARLAYATYLGLLQMSHAAPTDRLEPEAAKQLVADALDLLVPRST